LVVVAGEAALMRLGETLPMWAVARMQRFDRPFLFLAGHTDHIYRLKVEAAKQNQPDVLVIGSSRVNQFRRAMFRPLSFYNAGNSLYTAHDFVRFLEDAPGIRPRVILFSLDFYVFNPQWDEVVRFVDYGELGTWGSTERSRLYKALATTILDEPRILIAPKLDPWSGVPAFGLQAIRTGTGFRLDGSYQYGGVYRGDPRANPATLANALGRVAAGTPPFQPADTMAASHLAELEKFAAIARQRGSALIGITMPYQPALNDALAHSPRHGIRADFYGPAMQARLRQMGIVHVDFTDLATFHGVDSEFVDPFHPSEPAVLRMLITMLDRPEVRALLPELDRSGLAARLNGASRYEVYRHEF
jgi:hypothetical protein